MSLITSIANLEIYSEKNKKDVLVDQIRKALKTPIYSKGRMDSFIGDHHATAWHVKMIEADTYHIFSPLVINELSLAELEAAVGTLEAFINDLIKGTTKAEEEVDDDW